ncbi:glutaredoxin family protein [Evansella clarkii]|uniref:glutaredoxin family protein n=1 Tax=Evansella clarkii TaxID=79879 RepID=UPI000997CF5F|nr:glutaredoxin family protein [Evansella clarkii]
MADSIIVYTQSACGHCHRQMDWMNEKNIPFEEREISNQEYRAEFLNLKGKGTPLTLIKKADANEVVTGFNQQALTEKLQVR